MLVTSCLKASRILGDADIREFALTSLNRILQMHAAGGELFHTEGVKAVLDDYIYLTEALIAAYEVSGDPSYLHRADECMDACIGKFWDEGEGGFFDTETEVVGLRLKSIEDIPHPSANAVGILLLLQLYSMTGKVRYRVHAETAFKVFSSTAKDSPLHAAYYFCALEAFFMMMKLTIQAKPDSPLANTALASFIPYLSLVYEDDKGFVIPCIDTVCYEPIAGPEELKKFLREAYTRGDILLRRSLVRRHSHRSCVIVACPMNHNYRVYSDKIPGQAGMTVTVLYSKLQYVTIVIVQFNKSVLFYRLRIFPAPGLLQADLFPILSHGPYDILSERYSLQDQHDRHRRRQSFCIPPVGLKQQTLLMLS